MDASNTNDSDFFCLEFELKTPEREREMGKLAYCKKWNRG